MYSKKQGGGRSLIILNVAVVVALGLIFFHPIAQAEQPIDITYCLSLVSTVVSQNEEMAVTSFDFKGIARSNLPDKAFDNLTFHGVGVGRVVNGKNHNYGYIKFMDPDGNYVVTENLAPWMAQKPLGIFYRGQGNGRGLREEENLSPLPAVGQY